MAEGLRQIWAAGAMISARIPLAAILRTVAAHYNMPPRYLVEQDGARGQREWSISHPRQIAMYLARTLITVPTEGGKRRLPIAYTDIGRAFGGRDHSTVIFAIQQVQKRLLHDAKVQSDVRAILNALQECAGQPLLLEAA